MSADNFLVVCPYKGQFALVMGFMSDDGDIFDNVMRKLNAEGSHFPLYNTPMEAWQAAQDEYTEYGVFQHPDCVPNYSI